MSCKLKGDSRSQGQSPSNQQISWTAHHQAVLEQLIDFLVQPPIMAYPDFDSAYKLHTDPSETGLRAVLYQQQNGLLHVIAYASCTLTPTERNYYLHSGKLEFLALKWAICDHFQDYLYYTPSFTVYTDNNPLTYVRLCAKLNATGLCWVGEVQDFNFNIKYHPETVQRDADALSRISFDAYIKKCTEERSPDIIQAIVTSVHAQSQGESSWFTSISAFPGLRENDDTMLKSRTASTIKQMDLKQAKTNDASIGKVIQYLKSGNHPQVKGLHGEHLDTRQLLHEWLKLQIDHTGILHKKWSLYSNCFAKKYRLLVLKEQHETMVILVLTE